jgi:hypothetical protein
VSLSVVFLVLVLTVVSCLIVAIAWRPLIFFCFFGDGIVWGDA